MSEHKEEQKQEKDSQIIVNGRPKTVSQKEISYEEVAKLAFDDAFKNPDTAYTVTFKRGVGEKPEGSLASAALKVIHPPL